MNRRKLFLNAASSVLTYGFLLVFGIYTSKTVLAAYGSEVNGLLSSLGQVFSCLALLEAGIGTAAINALYRPLAAEDNDGVCAVLEASRSQYRRSAVWYFLCVTAAAFLWPLVLDTEIPARTICLMIFLQGISGVIAFCFVSTAVHYLIASGRNYVNNTVHILVSVLTCIGKLIICHAGLSVVYIPLLLAGINGLKCVFYTVYIRKLIPVYGRVKRKPDRSLLKQRTHLLIHEISGVIFSSTDTIVISIFCGLTDASVYAVYSMVLVSLGTILGQVQNSTVYILGERYTRGMEAYLKIHDLYNSLYVGAAFAVYTTAYLLLPPFMELYTAGVTDAAYLDPLLPLLFVTVQLLSACRITDSHLIKLSLHAGQTLTRTLAESVINIAASLVLVRFCGIYGVLLGTILALLYRTNDMILYANRKILKRSPGREYLLYAGNMAVFGLAVRAGREYVYKAESYLHLLVYAAALFLLIAVLYAAVNLLLQWKYVRHRIVQRRISG